jgi:hypothetical protein
MRIEEEQATRWPQILNSIDYLFQCQLFTDLKSLVCVFIFVVADDHVVILKRVLSGVRVTRSLVLCVCFVDRCLSLYNYSNYSSIT